MRRIGITLLLLSAYAAGGVTFRRPLERVASMDPIHTSAVYDSRAAALVYEPLLEVDYEARPTVTYPSELFDDAFIIHLKRW